MTILVEYLPFAVNSIAWAIEGEQNIRYNVPSDPEKMIANVIKLAEENQAEKIVIAENGLGKEFIQDIVDNFTQLTSIPVYYY